MFNSPLSVRSLTLGMIPYWNLLPLRSELAKQTSQDFVLKTGTPVQVNQWLQEGVVDLAPCSSVCLISKDFDMALPLGVSSYGAVKSVYLGFHKEHEDFLEFIQKRQSLLQSLFFHIHQNQVFDSRSLAKLFWSEAESLFSQTELFFAPSIRFSTASASSVALSKIFYYLWFGKEAYEQQVLRPSIQTPGRKSIELWIGDEALIQKRAFHKVLDLGTLWKDMTGLPFVFAVWQSRGACLNGARRRILSAGEIAETKMKIDPSAYHSMDRLPLDCQGKPIFLGEYWKVLQYKLGPQEFRGLLLFLCLTRQLQSLPLGESLMIKIMRWQEMSSNGRIPSL